MNIQHSSRSDRWFTPPHIISMVREVLGQIDLDPASEALANQRVQATRILTKEDNALGMNWWTLESCTMFVNPPSGKIPLPNRKVKLDTENLRTFLLSRYEYNPFSGILSSRRTGLEVGTQDGDYKCLNLKYYGFGKIYLHKAVYLMCEGEYPDVLDHIDGNRLNNSIFNLRPVPELRNLLNRPETRINSEHTPGVFFREGVKSKPWWAYYGSGDKRVNIGYYDTFGEAKLARLKFQYVRNPLTAANTPYSSKSKLFWEKFLYHREIGLLKHGIFVLYSIEQLSTFQDCLYAPSDFVVCIPRERIKYVNLEGNSSSPTHSSAIVYIPGLINQTSRFKEVFSPLGKFICGA